MSQRPGFPVKLSQTGASGPSTAKPSASAAPVRVASTVSTPTSMLLPRTASAMSGLGLDSGAVRARMVRKLAEQGVKDTRVLDAMGQVERHRFVESGLVNQAYEDTSLPIGLGQTISKPNVVARMIELLCQDAPGKLGRILEIGTGLSLIHI
jgi:protein-L-isoaspartate(D-aspartate) O-methyltransferase